MKEVVGSIPTQSTNSTHLQISAGSSGSGSRTGTSGFSGGSKGSLIGGGAGSAGTRQRYSRKNSTRHFMSFQMTESCQLFHSNFMDG
ncbi:MAG TPA: hypothetical protein VMR80_07005, partial [Candidatus Acidoferrum sp.]|nr:hypothetical protein [Candidatus Acidoferrum sp.]